MHPTLQLCHTGVLDGIRFEVQALIGVPAQDINLHCAGHLLQYAAVELMMGICNDAVLIFPRLTCVTSLYVAAMLGTCPADDREEEDVVPQPQPVATHNEGALLPPPPPRLPPPPPPSPLLRRGGMKQGG